MKLLILTGTLIICGCSSIDKHTLGNFHVVGDNQFRFTAKADGVYQEDSEWAENRRINWIESYLADNNQCRNGFAIDNREVVMRDGFVKGGHYITYKGHCTEEVN